MGTRAMGEDTSHCGEGCWPWEGPGLSQGGSGTHHRGRMGVLVLPGHGMCCQSTGHPVEGMSQPSAAPDSLYQLLSQAWRGSWERL